MKILSNIINISEYIVDFVDISKYILMTSTLAQSLRLAWFLKPTGANLRATGVYTNPSVLQLHTPKEADLFALQK